MKQDICYKYKNNLYLNITNRCTMRCPYCIKYRWRWKYRGYNLRLKNEPAAEEIIRAIDSRLKGIKEAVFCGYGEPTLRLDVIKTVAAHLKKSSVFVRINTNGHGDMINGRNICPELKGIVDRVSISLNVCNARDYYEMHKPVFGMKTFKGVIEFVKECRKYVPEVVITTVRLPGVDIKKCREIARAMGAGFSARKYLRGYEKT
ncbi:MAG: TatD family nuclease-associated radical SAM protein [Elusimicrobiota bacterium]